VTPLLAAAFTTAPENVRTHYLVALAYLLQGVPKAVLTSNLPQVNGAQFAFFFECCFSYLIFAIARFFFSVQIIPLLLESLAKKETLLLLAVLNTLESLLPEEMHHEVLSSHLQTMLPRLLPLTVPPLPMVSSRLYGIVVNFFPISHSDPKFLRTANRRRQLKKCSKLLRFFFFRKFVSRL